ncbi:FTS and Hook-interacting protein [Biomphalaria glabrata]|nr:FTS and Hook-interacting protein [Biomphalaria glabrata]
MSWFKRGSDRKSPESPAPAHADTDPNTCLEVFQNHWKQALAVISCQDKKSSLSNGRATPDGVATVLSNLEHMVTLLVNEDDDGGLPGPILKCVLSTELLESFCDWCALNVPVHEKLRLQQLRLFELIISQSKQLLLVHKPVIKPLLKLLIAVSDSQEINNGELEFKLVLVLHQICICISQQSLILESFFSTDTDHGPARFLIFSLLIPYIHREGPVGQRARDALLLIMTLSARHPHIGQYIANNSDFCPVLATGLSGLYSSLPRRLTPPSDDWHAITREDCIRIPDLQMFLNSLQFSNAVIQVAHPLVRDQLIHFIYSGFLVPVLAPALHQDIPGLPIPLLDADMFRISREEIMTATAYLDLFIRHVTDPHLLKATLKFVMTEKYDDVHLLDSLLQRINSNTNLSTVTLALFHTLIDLNCEDVMFQLIFRYLVPCTHVMVSQRLSIRDLDLYGKSAEKFLSLRPSCCIQSSFSLANASKANPLTPAHLSSTANAAQSPRSSTFYTPFPLTSPSTVASTSSLESQLQGESSYFEYLHDARRRLEQTGQACRHWTFAYDGESPLPDSIKKLEASIEEKSKAADNKKQELSPKTGFLEVGAIDKLESSNKPITSPKKEQPLISSVKEKAVLPNTNMCNNKTISGNNREVNPKLFVSLENLESFMSYLSSVEIDSGEFTGHSMEEVISSFSDFLDFTVNRHANKHRELGDSCDKNSVKVGTPSSINTFSKTINHNPVLISSVNPVSSSSEASDLTLKNVDSNDSPTAVTKSSTSAASSHKERSVPKDFPSSLRTNLNPLYAGTSPVKPLPSSSEILSPLRTEDPVSPNYRRQLNYSNDPPNIGPFLCNLLSRLEGMIGNSLYFNLLLTDIISRLAAYPQPLLRSFLLNHNLVFQPTVKSLFQVLSSLRQKVESFSVTVQQFDAMVNNARQNLSQREDMLFQFYDLEAIGSPAAQLSLMPNPVKIRADTIDLGIPIRDKKKVTLSDLFFRRPTKGKLAASTKDSSQLQNVQVDGQTAYRFLSSGNAQSPGSQAGIHSLATWNAVYCALILDEFLKELAALSQEHSVLHLDEGYLSS